MKLSTSPPLRGQIAIPGDKSISHRGVILGAISTKTTVIHNFLHSQDCHSTIDCFRKLGVEIRVENDTVTVHGRGLDGLRAPAETLYAGNSGTTMRLMAGLLAAQGFSSRLEGDGSLSARPMNRVIKPLELMGAKIESSNGYAPLSICGARLSGIDYTLPVASAQLKSALILAGLYADGQTVINQPVICRDHTEVMLAAFGAGLETKNGKITVTPGKQPTGCEFEVPGDISSAAFFMVAALIVPGSQILIKNVGLNKTRAGIIEVLLRMGADIKIQNLRTDVEQVGDILVTHSLLTGTCVGGEEIPLLIDEIPVIAVAAAFAKGRTVIADAAELKVKETNRIDTTAAELTKAGVDITPTADGMVINGGSPVHGGAFCSYGDHRIAMAMSVLALAAQGESVIENARAADVSFPTFYALLEELRRG